MDLNSLSPGATAEVVAVVVVTGVTTQATATQSSSRVSVNAIRSQQLLVSCKHSMAPLKMVCSAIHL